MVTLLPSRFEHEQLQAFITGQQRARLEAHPLFSALVSVAHLRAFMEIHVFAVWDFMSLAKRLQRELTHTDVPWLPPRDSEAARLINEIVLAEESDLGFDGHAISHFDLYLGGMREVGADTTVITRFLKALRAGTPTDEALADPDIPGFVSDFVGKTLATALHGSRLQVMASFLYGRENVIPGMFQSLLNNWGLCNEDAPRFAYYLQRHIEVDTDTHGPAAARLIARELEAHLEGLEVVRRTAEEAIDARQKLWDGALDHLRRFVG
jgi:Protein of unknown function (DUF3050)